MNDKQADVFQQTYEFYLDQINQIDWLAKADILGLETRGDKLFIPLYNKRYLFDKAGISTQDGGKITAGLRVMICKYILTCPMELPSHERCFQPYREFENAAPLISHFATTTTMCLENTFAGKVNQLKTRCLETGGVEQGSDVYDISFEFRAFPRIPVIMNFNDRDDMFPAACSVLFSSSAQYFLDMECLCMAGSQLASILCGK